MILPDFVLPTRANQVWAYSGIDSLDGCRNIKHFESYPYIIQYQYNSRGFRDEEWPNELKSLTDSIWCLGDSFTVGIGSPKSHTWTAVLQQASHTKTINVSMDGASNNWLSRKAVEILQEISPKIMIIHWSYISRRENDVDSALDLKWQKFYHDVRDPSWPDCDRHNLNNLPKFILDEITNVHQRCEPLFCSDEDRILQFIKCSEHDDIENTISCIKLVDTVAINTKVIHSFIPHFVPKKFNGVIESQLSGCVIPEIVQIDFARDGFHYDLLTSQHFVNQLLPLLN